MRVIQEVNILENKKIVIWLNILTIPLFVMFSFFFEWLGAAIIGSHAVRFDFGLGKLLLFFLALIAVFFIHEMIHGVFFKLFKPENRVKFGIKWESGMIYATSPGSIYSKKQMLIISLAPFITWTFVFSLLLAVKLMGLAAYVALASIHAAGCVGDLYYAYLMLFKHSGKEISVQDTETGLIIYQSDDQLKRE
ncbi:DUF3267 domain-containing protein [Streptococcus dentasini]